MGRALRQRILLALGIVTVEYIALYIGLAHAFDGDSLQALPAIWRTVLWQGTLAIAGLGVFVAVMATYFHRDARTAFDDLAIPPIDWSALAAHLIAMLTLGAGTFAVLSEPETARSWPLASLALWLFAGAASTAGLALGLFGSALTAVLRRLRWPLLGSALAGLGVAGAGIALIAAWDELARPSLVIAASLLRFAYGSVHVDPEAATLSLSRFGVHVAPTCSGVEGVGLLTAFLAGFLIRYRSEFRFPQAFVLLPLGASAAFLLNSVRIAALVALGQSVSPELAKGAFHSMAGWLVFCGLAVGVAALARDWKFVAVREASESRAGAAPEADDATSAFLVPFLIWLALGMVGSALTEGVDESYPVKVVACLGVLWAYRQPLRARFASGPQPVERASLGWLCLPIGGAVCVLWLGLPPPAEPEALSKFAAELSGMGDMQRWGWIGMRVTGAVVTAPIVEELAFRGYLQRRLIAGDFSAVSLRRFRMLAWLGSALLFGALHANWVAGLLAGLAFSAAAMLRGRLRDAIVAHGFANALLFVWALQFERWDLL